MIALKYFLSQFSDKKRGRRRPQRAALSGGSCSHHLIELCPLPQWCNSFCPAFINRMTGEEIDVFQLFAMSSIDRATIADMLSMDQNTINSMNINNISKLLLDTFRHKSR